MLFVKGESPEASVAFEILEKNGLSLDLIATENRGGFGGAVDIYKDKVDLGIYAVSEFDSFDPKIGVGLNIKF